MCKDQLVLFQLLWAEPTGVRFPVEHSCVKLEHVPQVGIYLPLYDYCLGGLWGPTGMYAPLLAGSIARVVAVMCSAPLELMRTRMQVRSPFFCHMSPAQA